MGTGVHPRPRCDACGSPCARPLGRLASLALALLATLATLATGLEALDHQSSKLDTLPRAPADADLHEIAAGLWQQVNAMEEERACTPGPTDNHARASRRPHCARHPPPPPTTIPAPRPCRRSRCRCLCRQRLSGGPSAVSGAAGAAAGPAAGRPAVRPTGPVAGPVAGPLPALPPHLAAVVAEFKALRASRAGANNGQGSVQKYSATSRCCWRGALPVPAPSSPRRVGARLRGVHGHCQREGGHHQHLPWRSQVLHQLHAGLRHVRAPRHAVSAPRQRLARQAGSRLRHRPSRAWL